MIYGYARVSSRDQSLARQLDALDAFGYVDRVLGWDMSKSHSQNQARSSMTHDLVRRCRALAERERGE